MNPGSMSLDSNTAAPSVTSLNAQPWVGAIFRGMVWTCSWARRYCPYGSECLVSAANDNGWK
jgi:hypothetical protein